MATRIPSAEEIRAIVEHKADVARANDIVDERLVEAEEKNDSLQGHLQGLQRQIKSLSTRGKMTPQEAREALQLIFAKHDMNPAEELVSMVMERQGGDYRLEPDLRAKILLELNQYVMPKLRSVEVTGTVNHAHQIVIVRFGEDGSVKREQLKSANPKAPVTSENQSVADRSVNVPEVKIADVGGTAMEKDAA